MKSTRYLSRLLVAISVFLSLTVPLETFGGGTRMWELAGFEELDKGELDGTQVSSLGEVCLGKREKKLGLDGIGLVWSAVRAKTGEIYLGTGYDGKIFRVRGDNVVEIATTGQLIVTSLAIDEKGDLFAGTLPDPVVWKIPSPAKVATKKPVEAKKWVTLSEDVKHVWALVFGRGGILYAGTGPEGKLLSIGRDKKATVYLDTEEDHILSLLEKGKGKLLAGTSPGALLLEVSGPGRAVALADFDATEVKAIAMTGDDLFAAVNTFSRPPAVPTKSSKKSKNASSKGTSFFKKKSSRDIGDGKLYRIGKNMRVEKLWERKKSHVVSMAVTPSGVLFAGLGAEGKVISVDDYRVVRTELDLDERQVMTLLAGKDLDFVATGDAGSAYSIARSRKAEAVYLAPPLDAKRTSSWGRLTWFSEGKLRVQTRSGNTVRPDTNWSDWSKPVARGNLVASPDARYLQLRFSWTLEESATLVSAELAYKPQNLRTIVTSFNPDSRYPTPKRSSKKEQGEVSTRTVNAQPSKRNKAKLELKWKVSNPDSDTMRYNLWYRTVGEKLWRRITKEDTVLKETRYTWDTDTVPEGHYQLRLTADDSPSNDAREVLEDEFVSVPVLVDNHQPTVKGLGFGKGTVRGAATDTFSAISGLEFAVDNGPWMPLFVKDGIFDEKMEEFEFALPKDLESGPHAVAVRAFDRAGNMGTAEIHIVQK